jgi:hypothetical protein
MCKELMLDVTNELSSMDVKQRFAITYLVCVFEDCIGGLWVGGTCNHCFNSIGLKEFLKLDSSEFGSLVMKMDEGMWCDKCTYSINQWEHYESFKTITALSTDPYSVSAILHLTKQSALPGTKDAVRSGGCTVVHCTG